MTDFDGFISNFVAQTNNYSTFASFGVKGVKGFKGVEDNSAAMAFNPETKTFHGESFVFNSFNSLTPLTPKKTPLTPLIKK